MDIAATTRPEFTLLKSLLGATVVTMSLLYFMHVLIHTDELPPPVETIPMPDVVGVPKVLKTITEEPKPKKIEPPAEPPPTLPFERPQTSSPQEFNGKGMGYEPTKTLVDGSIGISTGGIIQQVMVPPAYPQRALTKGIEGFVDVKFDVTAMGSTDRVQVVQASPEGVFERAAIRAVKRWKYLPDDARKGNPATLRERIRFAINP